MKPEIELPAYGGHFWKWVDRAGADGAAGAHDQKRPLTRLDINRDAVSQRRKRDSLFLVRRNPSDGLGAQARNVCGLLHPGVRFRGAIGAQTASTHALLAYVPPCLCLPRSEKADDVCHIAATDKQTAAIGWVAQKLGYPADRLCFDLAGHW